MRIPYVIFKRAAFGCAMVDLILVMWSNQRFFFLHFIFAFHRFVDIQAKIVCSISRMDFLFCLWRKFPLLFLHAARLRISHHLWLEMCTRKPVHPFHPVTWYSAAIGMYLKWFENTRQQVFYFSRRWCGCSVRFFFHSYVAFRLRAMTSSDGSGKKCHIHKEGFHQGIRFLHAIEIEFVVRLFALRCIFDCLWCY